jgi:hypothetical protein
MVILVLVSRIPWPNGGAVRVATGEARFTVGCKCILKNQNFSITQCKTVINSAVIVLQCTPRLRSSFATACGCGVPRRPRRSPPLGTPCSTSGGGGPRPGNGCSIPPVAQVRELNVADVAAGNRSGSRVVGDGQVDAPCVPPRQDGHVSLERSYGAVNV